MPSITASQLRSKYLAFFASRGHAAIPSASLVPANDPSVLFTTAGMHPLAPYPLAPYLLGQPHRRGGGWWTCRSACGPGTSTRSGTIRT